MKRILLTIFICLMLLISKQAMQSSEKVSQTYSTIISQLINTFKKFFTQSTPITTKTEKNVSNVSTDFNLFTFTYNPKTNKLTILSPTQEIIHNVISYQLSPHKNYFIIFQETSSGLASRGTGEFLGEKISKRIQMLLYNPITGKLYTTFDPGSILTYSFDPSEDLLMIAGLRKPWGTLAGMSKPSTIHESAIKGFRQPSDTGNILQYEIFDITSETQNTRIKTIENIQAIQFNKKHELLVKYDDNATEKIQFTPQSHFFNTLINPMLPTSLVRTWNITTTSLSSQEKTSLIGTMYDDKTKIFTLTSTNGLTKEFENISSYQISPQKNFIIINSLTQGWIDGPKRFFSGTADLKTELVNTKTGTPWKKTFLNVAFYMFNANETRLLIFYTPAGWTGAYDHLEYQLFDTSSETSLKKFENIRCAYFEKSTNEIEKLIIIDNQGKKIEYDPITGLSYQEMEKQSSFAKTPLDTSDIAASKTQKAEQKPSSMAKLYAVVQKFAADTTQYITSTVPVQTDQTIKLRAKLPKKASPEKTIIPILTQPKIKEQTVSAVLTEEENQDDDEIEQYEDIAFLMKKFEQNKDKNTVEKIITELGDFEEQENIDIFFTEFNKYNLDTKKTFCSLFFAKPTGDFNDKGIDRTECESLNFSVSLTNDMLFIRKNGKNIFTEKDFNDCRTMVFDSNEKYFACSYNTNTASIDIFELNAEKNTVMRYTTFASDKWSSIIGIKFIKQLGNKLYLFFIDKTYKIGIYDIQKKEILK